MADDYKKNLNWYVDVGGFNCPCCNIYFKKSKRLLNKLARAKLKNDFKKSLKYLDYDYE